MHERKNIDLELAAVEQELRTLETRFEQYLAGVEKRAPILERDSLARRLRLLANRRITQTDLRFRCQTLATRFHTYCGHWDRIMRLVEEGRRVRPSGVSAPSCDMPTPPPSAAQSEVDEIYRQILAARNNGRLEGAIPDRAQLTTFLEKQREQIRAKFGDRPVEFFVEAENGRARIKVRARR